MTGTSCFILSSIHDWYIIPVSGIMTGIYYHILSVFMSRTLFMCNYRRHLSVSDLHHFCISNYDCNSYPILSALTSGISYMYQYSWLVLHSCISCHNWYLLFNPISSYDWYFISVPVVMTSTCYPILSIFMADFHSGISCNVRYFLSYRISIHDWYFIPVSVVMTGTFYSILSVLWLIFCSGISSNDWYLISCISCHDWYIIPVSVVMTGNSYPVLSVFMTGITFPLSVVVTGTYPISIHD